MRFYRRDDSYGYPIFWRIEGAGITENDFELVDFESDPYFKTLFLPGLAVLVGRQSPWGMDFSMEFHIYRGGWRPIITGGWRPWAEPPG